MTEDDKQAVADTTDDQTQAGSEDNGAQDDLDKLLAEYDEETSTGDKPNESEQKAGSDDDLRKQVEAIQRERALDTYRRDMAETIKAVRGDIDESIMDDDMVEAWLETRAKKDERLSRAWTQRHNRPKEWAKVVNGLGKELAGRFSSLPDKNATEDREAVAAAVRGQSNRTPESEPAPNYKGKSNHDFREDVAQKFGYRPHV